MTRFVSLPSFLQKQFSRSTENKESCIMKLRPDDTSSDSSKRTKGSSTTSSSTTFGGTKCGKVDTGFATTYRTSANVAAEAKYSEFPWLVSIQRKRLEYFVPKCAGSIIASKYLLTAAHCFYNWVDSSRITKKDIRTRMRVVAGTANLNSSHIDPNAQFGKIKHVWIPKRYSDVDASHKYDIAVVKLRKPLNSYGTNIHPICLPHQTKRFPKTIAMAGWGDKLSPYGTKLYKLVLLITHNRECERKLKHLEVKLTRLQLCSISGKHDTCIDDIGGPGMQIRDGRMNLIGIVSFQSVCHGGAIIYTKVKKYTKWIEKVVHKMENGRAPPR